MWGLPWVTHPKAEFQRSRAQVAEWLGWPTLNQLVEGSIPRIHIILQDGEIIYRSGIQEVPKRSSADPVVKVEALPPKGRAFGSQGVIEENEDYYS